MKHELFFLGRTKEAFLSAGIEEYSARLRRYAGLSIHILKEKNRPGQSEQAFVEQEAEQLLQSIGGTAKVVALDGGGGRHFSSEELAGLLASWEQQGVKNVCYLIGGYLGLAPRVLQRADLCLSLSRMTFTHEIARLLLLEQLYRAYTIKAGEKYHK